MEKWKEEEMKKTFRAQKQLRNYHWTIDEMIQAQGGFD